MSEWNTKEDPDIIIEEDEIINLSFFYLRTILRVDPVHLYSHSFLPSLFRASPEKRGFSQSTLIETRLISRRWQTLSSFLMAFIRQGRLCDHYRGSKLLADFQ